MAVGRPTDYDPNFHPEDCIKMGREGMFAVEMADKWDVSVQTMNTWTKLHPEFLEAYKKSQSYRASKLLKICRDGLISNKEKQLNALAWSMIMRYDGQNTDERTVSVPELSECKTFTEMCQCLIKAFGDSRLTCKEANTLADLITKSAKVDEVTELRSMLEQIKEKTSK